jgi:1-acyl-sn-glycerol-3-phosphate acyltransferase
MIYVLTRIRSAIGLAFVVLWTVLYSVPVMISGLLKKHDLATALIHNWSQAILGVFGIGIRVRGEENIPGSGGGILVFNHQSHFDIPAIVASTRKRIRFGAKIELFSVPFFGIAMRAVGTLPITRDNRKEVFRIYKDAEERFRQGFLFVLAPEGTRQREPEIGRFKKGPFIFALNAQVPLIPVVIRGAHKVLKKNSLYVNIGTWHSVIDVQFLPPISTVGLKLEDVDLLMEKTRGLMLDAYNAATVEPDFSTTGPDHQLRLERVLLDQH